MHLEDVYFRSKTSGLWCRVVMYDINVSDDLAASIFRWKHWIVTAVTIQTSHVYFDSFSTQGSQNATPRNRKCYLLHGRLLFYNIYTRATSCKYTRSHPYSAYLKCSGICSTISKELKANVQLWWPTWGCRMSLKTFYRYFSRENYLQVFLEPPSPSSRS
jgi:hypothetical protein